ncbi:MAG: hypothetical protein M1835_001112 [Candelina submexicana]|nr:MAG: hypothetical protein M1835_001112 [Candelina submexicana]
MPSPSFCLWDFAPPNYLALLLALQFRSLPQAWSLPFSLASWLLSLPDFLCSYHFLLFSMAKLKSAKGFFNRARARGSEKNKDSVNREEVKKELQDATKRNHRRALALWDQYKTEHPEATPQSIEASKDFVRCIAFGVEEKHDNPWACLSTVVQAYKDFTGGWQWTGNQKTDKNVTVFTSNFIKFVLQVELGLAREKRKRCYAVMIHFVHLGTQVWQSDRHKYDRPGTRIEVWAEIQLYAFTSARVGEYIESTCRKGSGRGLHFRDIAFGVFRNEHGRAEFAIQIVKDAKEELLAIKPPEEEMFRLEWDLHMLDTPVYQRKDGAINSARVFSQRSRDLGFCAGYARPPTIHDFRAEGLHQINKLYSSTQRMQHGGHTSANTYGDFYAPRNPGTDGQNSYLGDKPRTIVNDLFRAMTLSRNPELWQSLPAEKQHELQNSHDFIAIEEELEKLSSKPKEDAAARDHRRKELYAQKRKLVSEELRKCQQLQPRKAPSKAQKTEQIRHHCTQFSRTKQLMPQRRRLAGDLFTITPICSETGRAVLRDMIDLYQQDTEVAFHPGLEPEKCCCAVEQRRQIDMKPAPQKWNHIYSCYRKKLRASHELTELCFAFSEWFTSEETWTDHCQAHLDGPEGIPTQCNPFSYGGCLASPGYCPWCLGNAKLPATARMQQFPDRPKWQAHVDEHVAKLDSSKTLICPHPRVQCTEAFESVQEFKFHLQDVHCVVPGKGFKRSSPESEPDTRPRKFKRPRETNRPDPEMETEVHVKQEYHFMDEAVKLQSRDTSWKSTASFISSKRSTSTPEWNVDSVERGTETPPSPTCSDGLDNIDPRLRAGATPPFAGSSLSPGNNNATAVPFHNATEVVDLTGLDSEPTHALALMDFSEHTVTSQNDTSAVRYKHDEGDPSISAYSLRYCLKLEATPSRFCHFNLKRLKEFFADGQRYRASAGMLAGGPSTAGKEDLAYAPSAGVEALQDEPPVVDVDDGQFLVERLLRKRVCRVKRRKVIQYLVKWKGYAEEENTWADKMDIHEDVIKEYESASVSAP